MPLVDREGAMSANNLSERDSRSAAAAPNWDAYTVICQIDLRIGMQRLLKNISIGNRRTLWVR